MAKAATKKPGTAVATKKTGAVTAGVPSYLANKKMTGKGVSTRTEDMLIPMVRILQKMSPEVDENTPQYIKGAKPGDFIIKNGPRPIIKGDDGFLFQPCVYYTRYVEWLPRSKGGGGGAGFVASHIEEPTDTISAPDPQNEERTIRIRKGNKNLVVETRYYVGFMIDEEDHSNAFPAVVPMASSNHTPAKAWNMLQRNPNKNIGENPADLWAVYYRLKSISRTKGPNTWSMYDITDAGEEDDSGFPTVLWAPTDADFARGESTNKGFDERRVDASGAGPDDVPGAGGNKDKM